MPVGIFRGGCLTGRNHAAVELHGFLGYIVLCARTGRRYRIYGHKGKQVRDQLDSRDVARLFLEFYEKPRPGEVYNLGGGRNNSASILETIAALRDRGLTLQYDYEERPRIGDHICYISNLTKISTHFPNWRPEYDFTAILDSMVGARSRETGQRA
jgi:CDP-paratose 2-epimerase